MTIIGIWKTKQKLYEILNIPEISKQLEPLKDLAKRTNAYIPIYKINIPMNMDIFDERNGKKEHRFESALQTTELPDDIKVNEIIHNIHIVLQTEMMLQACIFAAAAAFLSLIGIVLFLFK